MPTLHVTLVAGEDIPPADSNGLSDPYAVLTLGGHQKKKSSVKYKTLNPEWAEEFAFQVDADAGGEELVVEVWDKDTLSSDFLGRGALAFSPAQAEADYGMPTPLTLDLAKDSSMRGRVKIMVRYDANTTISLGGSEKKGLLTSLVSNVAGAARSAIATAHATATGATTTKKTGVHRLVSIHVVSGRGLPGVDKSGTSDPYAIVKLGRRVQRTRVAYKTRMPEWHSQMEFRVMDFGGTVDPTLHIKVYDYDFPGADTMLGFVSIDLTQLPLNVTDEKFHRLQPPQAEKKSMLGSAFSALGGKKVVFDEKEPPEILVSVTVQDLFVTLTSEDVKQMGPDVVGHLVVRVGRSDNLAYAKGAARPMLSGNIPDADPFVTVRCGGFTARTPSIAKTYEPTWNHTLVVPIKDLFDTVLVRVLDDDVSGVYRSMGSVAIPLLSVKSAVPTWYALKTDSLLQPAQGAIELSLAIEYNPSRALLKVIKRRTRDVHAVPDSFKSKILKGHVDRVKAMALAPLPYVRMFVRALDYDYGPAPAVAILAGWTLFWLVVQLWHVPLGIGVLFLLTGAARFRAKPKDFDTAALFAEAVDGVAGGGEGEEKEAMGGSGGGAELGEEDAEDDTAEDAEEDAAAEADGSASATMSRRGLLSIRSQIRQLTAVAQQLQNALGAVADSGERVKNLVMWEVPPLSLLVMVGCFAGAFVLWLVPFRYLAILGGWNRVVRRGLRKYHPAFKRAAYHKPVLEVVEFVGRVPTDLDVEKRKRLPVAGHLRPGSLAAAGASVSERRLTAASVSSPAAVATNANKEKAT